MGTLYGGGDRAKGTPIGDEMVISGVIPICGEERQRESEEDICVGRRDHAEGDHSWQQFWREDVAG